VTRGTLMTATATCPDGKVLLGGGAQITDSSETGDTNDRVVLRSSYPSSTTEWTATAVVIDQIYGFRTVTVQAFALCSL
jgi:hypothetical protein